MSRARVSGTALSYNANHKIQWFAWRPRFRVATCVATQPLQCLSNRAFVDTLLEAFRSLKNGVFDPSPPLGGTQTGTKKRAPKCQFFNIQRTGQFENDPFDTPLDAAQTYPNGYQNKAHQNPSSKAIRFDTPFGFADPLADWHTIDKALPAHLSGLSPSPSRERGQETP